MHLKDALIVLGTAAVVAPVVHRLRISPVLGFFAVGAYASALLTTTGHAPIPVGWLIALICGGVAGLIVTLSTTRLREEKKAKKSKK